MILGCSSSHPSPNLRLTGTKLEAKQNSIEGYKEDICIEYHDSQNTKLMILDKLSITQEPDECFNQLELKAMSEKKVEYQGDTSMLSVEDVIENKKKEKCPLVCSLKEQNCSTEMSPTKAFLSKDEIKLTTTLEKKGQTINICLECANAVEKIQKSIQLI